MRRAVPAAAAALSVVALAGCGGPVARSAGHPAVLTAASTATRPPVPTAANTATRPPVPTAASTVTSAPVTPAASTRNPGLPPFASTVRTVTAADLPHTYRAGCPTPPAQLRMLSVSYVDFGGRPQTGRLVVNAGQVGPVLSVFADLYAHRFPIRRMVPVDAYGGSDDASVAADNTAGFNCRAAVTAGPTSWSMHAYGEAIDVDPVENPYVEGAHIDPSDGAAYLDRSAHRPGMAYAGGELVAAFARAGWTWGASFQDYQHFSVNGR